jgi:hypothetical protein
VPYRRQARHAAKEAAGRALGEQVRRKIDECLVDIVLRNGRRNAIDMCGRHACSFVFLYRRHSDWTRKMLSGFNTLRSKMSLFCLDYPKNCFPFAACAGETLPPVKLKEVLRTFLHLCASDVLPFDDSSQFECDGRTG